MTDMNQRDLAPDYTIRKSQTVYQFAKERVDYYARELSGEQSPWSQRRKVLEREHKKWVEKLESCQ